MNTFLLINKQPDIKLLYDQINGVNNKNKECFCQLPLMMGSSKFQLGALNSQKKFLLLEEINSVAISCIWGNYENWPYFYWQTSGHHKNECRIHDIFYAEQSIRFVNLLANMEDINDNNNTDTIAIM